jgi:acetolactate synthase-1/2/3 large subunit
MNISEAIVENLELIGVEYAFGGSGAGIDDFIFALHDSKAIKTIITRNEQGASFMACGYAMFSEKLGFCFATPGPGALNLVSGLAVALCDSLPVLAVTGYETSQGIGKGGLGETTGLNRTPDSRKLFAAITKKTYLIEKPTQTCDIIEDALNTAFEGRPGPVQIHLPFDISRAEVPNYREIQLRVKKLLPTEKQVNHVVSVLEKAIQIQKKIIILMGYGCVRSHAEAGLLELVEKYRIPFITTMDAKGILREDHPLSLGMTGASGDPGARRALLEADVVLALGNSFSKWQTWRWAEGLYDSKLLIQINIDKQAINRVYHADIALICDIKPAVDSIIRELDKRMIPVSQSTPAVNKYHDQPIKYSGLKIHGGALVKVISKLLPPKSIVLGDAGAHMLWLGAYLRLTQGQIYQNPGIFGSMATSVDAAIGIQCANPQCKVIVGCGDMGYQMAGFELMTAVMYKIPVIWIIFNNGEYNVIKMMQKRNYDGKEAFNNFVNPNFAEYARVCGALGYRVEKLEDFAAAFEEVLAAGRPAVIDVVVDPEVYPPFGLLDGSLQKQEIPH